MMKKWKYIYFIINFFLDGKVSNLVYVNIDNTWL
jgi:hypothetical protein